jgi:elongation factor G
MAHGPEHVRNFALVGHGHSGKTALIDALAFHARLVTRHGNSADGTSISNTEPEEKERKQTLSSHLFHVQVGDVQLNMLDTPGHSDFAADATAALHVVETAVLCISASAPVPFHARQLWRKAEAASAGRAIVLTHIDGENVDFDKAVEELRLVFGDTVVPVTYPNATGTQLQQIHDVMARQGPKAAELHEKLEEQVALVDDDLLEHYLENGALQEGELQANLGRAIAMGKLVPLFAMAAPKDLGLAEFAAFASASFPSPVVYGARNVGKPGAEGYPDLLQPDPAGPFAAKVFKVLSDPYVGRLAYMRCYSGTLKAEQVATNVRSGRQHKIAHILSVQGKETKDVPSVGPGDLFAVSKIDDFCLGDAVTDGAQIAFPPASFPAPTYSQHIWPRSRGDEQKIGPALEKLAAEDPTFRVRRDKDTGELIAEGMSPLHLEVQFLRMQRRYQVGVEHAAPTIPYRETVTAKAEGHHRHKKQTGGRGQFAEVYLRVFHKEAGSGFEFIDAVVGGSIPRQFIPEVEKGVRKFLVKGGLAGFPVVDVAAEVYDGKYHDVDSDQISFQLAGERAFADGYQKARPILLEPIMDVEIHVPERFTGDVAGNLSGSRGRMSGMEVLDGIQHIKAQVPLVSMQDYSTQLRSITAGEGTFTMKFAHYEQAPPTVQAEVVARFKKAQEAAKDK